MLRSMVWIRICISNFLVRKCICFVLWSQIWYRFLPLLELWLKTGFQKNIIGEKLGARITPWDLKYFPSPQTLAKPLISSSPRKAVRSWFSEQWILGSVSHASLSSKIDFKTTSFSTNKTCFLIKCSFSKLQQWTDLVIIIMTFHWNTS